MGWFRESERIKKLEAGTERLVRQVAELEAKLNVVLQLTAIRMADPVLYDRVIDTVIRWQKEPEADGKTGEPDDGGQEAGDAAAQLANMMSYTGREQPPDGTEGRT